MGIQFKLRDANLVSYILRSASGERSIFPRVTRFESAQFLRSLLWEETTIDGGTGWRDLVRRAAETALIQLDRIPIRENAIPIEVDHEPYLANEDEKMTFSFLAPLFQGFVFSAVVVGRGEDARATYEVLARGSKEYGLALFPDCTSEEAGFKLLDPFFDISLLGIHPERLPGVIFSFGADGKAVLLPLPKAREMLYRLIVPFFEELREKSVSRGRGSSFELAMLSTFQIREEARTTLFEILHKESNSIKTRPKLLHLSDLHIESAVAESSKGHLRRHLQDQVLQRQDRIVITGDLVDQPRKESFCKFADFRLDLKQCVDQDPILVPGNHDQRRSGNNLWWFGNREAAIAGLAFQPITVDHNLQAVFVSFNYSKLGNFARGKVSVVELKERSRELVIEKSKIKDDSYSHVALVHHHPFSFNVKTETLVQRALAMLGQDDERFLKMINADVFVTWCFQHKLDLILHGHKHVARIVNASKERRRILSVGCGTSLGAENYSLSYNVLTRAVGQKNWNVTVYECRPEYGIFNAVALQIHQLNL